MSTTFNFVLRGTITVDSDDEYEAEHAAIEALECLSDDEVEDLTISTVDVDQEGL